ncbi:hypothetical protein [Kribbella speibonae]|uniref:Uncharacterized protein n=1 Tax=Kribbella speibonae TaxID=1572660 RepID=A0ABY2AEE2_9ACTN|nr:hypothetical protein [Kribbella speibonae]TCC28044.1 hypothetical protein E0H58_08995 [Kribbella speibonae]
MKRFVVPPSWPSPPRRNWIPPKTWRPDPSWPPAPEDWRFWVDAKGEPVLGPIGRYGAPSRRAAYAAGAAMIVFAGVNLWAVLMIGQFNGPDDSAVVTFVEESPSPAVSSTSPAVPRTTSAPPLVPRTIVVPSTRPTFRPTRKPTATKPTATKKTERTTPTPTPTPTRTTTSTPTARPSRPTSRPSTREELLRQYCIDRGIDPAWCDPANWEQTP